MGEPAQQMSLALDIVKYVVWVVAYFTSIGVLSIMVMALVYMVGMMVVGWDITDSEPGDEL